jgi:endo-1,4-beta-D-glucanase Y
MKPMSPFALAYAACAVAAFFAAGCSHDSSADTSPVANGSNDASSPSGTATTPDASPVSTPDASRTATADAGATGGGSPHDASSGAADTGAAPDGAAPPPAAMIDAASLGPCTPPPMASVNDAIAAYAKWKNDLLTTSGARGFVRVLRPDSPGEIDTSNSEGTAYGMLLAAAMNDPATFDGLWNYSQLFLDSNGLMNWEIDPNGDGPTSEGSGAATDADEDMAYALLWADARWGGKGTLSTSYHDLAVKQINAVWSAEVDHTRNDAIAPGDQFGGASIVNISYFAPSYYRLFATASGQSGWNNAVDTSYTIIAASLSTANGNATNGLVPAWCTPSGELQAPSGKPTNYQLDSCRTPFRIAEDYCFSNEPRAKAYLEKISAFYTSVGAANIVDGYDLNGTPDPSHTTVHQSAAFVGPAAVGAMSDPAFDTLRNQAYEGVATLMELDGTTYYTESWTALSLVMLTGGFWNPSQP